MSEYTKADVDLAFALCHKLFHKFLRERSAVSSALNAMLLSRQMYSLSHGFLETALTSIRPDEWTAWTRKALDELADDDMLPSDKISLTAETVPSMMLEFLVQAVVGQASDLVISRFLTDFSGVVEWFLTRLHEFDQQQAAKVRTEAEQKAEELLAQPVMLPFAFDADGGQGIHRADVLLLVGWRPAVNFMLDLIRDSQLSVLSLTSRSSSAARPDRINLVEVRNYRGCCATSDSLRVYLSSNSQTYSSKFEKSPDVLMIEDIYHAGDLGLVSFSGQRVVGIAADAVRRSRPVLKTAKLVGVYGLPLDDDKPVDYESNAQVWANLREHCVVRQIRVRREDDTFCLTLEQSHWSVKVPSDVLLPQRLIT